MSNRFTDQIADTIMDLTEKIHFLRKEDEFSYAKKWYEAVMNSGADEIDGKVIDKCKPPVFQTKPASDEWLRQQEDKFINSFSE
jgi:hypothetical protein